MARSTWTSVGSALLAVCALGAAGMGCAPGNPSLMIIGNLAPSDECAWDPGGTEYVGRPIIDVDPLSLTAPLVGGYTAYFSMQNNIISRYSQSFPVMGDTADVTLTGAEVELVGLDGNRLPHMSNTFYRTTATGTISSAEGSQSGQGLGVIQVIPGAVAAELPVAFENTPSTQSQFVARIVAIGVTQGGVEVRSPEYSMTIQACYGCLYTSEGLPDGVADACTAGQDALKWGVAGFVSPTPCTSSDDCASGLCTMGVCAL